MGRPDADSSSYENDQPQEYQNDDFSSQTYETNYNDSAQEGYYQSQYADGSANNPQEQQQPPQQQQPPPPPPPPQQQQQQYPPPQSNLHGHGGQPAQPSQFPPRGPQTNPMYANGPNRPAPYPPQGPQTNPAQPPAPYPPQGGQQTFQTQPVQFPPPSPVKAAAYPPQGQQPFPNQPAQFPPQMHQNGTTEPAKFPPQPFPPNATQQTFQNGFQANQGQPQVEQFPPKSPVNGIPMQMNQQQGAWTTGIFDCMEDPTNAIATVLFPCVTYGQIAEIVDNGQTTCATNGMIYGLVAFCIGMPCLVSCGYRSKLRAKYGLIEDPAPDWLTHFLFEWCALCQEYRELNNRGLDPAIGWQGNIARQNMQQAQVGMVPPMNQRMMP